MNQDIKFDDSSFARWIAYVDLLGKLVANIGFPIIVASALLLVVWRALPTLEALNLTMTQVSTNLAINSQHENDLAELLRSQAKKMDDDYAQLQLHDRKDDQYHQDFMLSHPYPLPSDPPRSLRHRDELH